MLRLLAAWALAALAALDAADEAALEKRLVDSVVVCSAHYRIESDCVEAGVRKLSDELETYHAFLAQRFAGHVDDDQRRMTLRFFRRKQDYLSYGAAHVGNFTPLWAGYYACEAVPEEREVVGYDLSGNFAVMRHEALHQFMHRAFAGIYAWPHWFNEGLADYAARGRVVKDAYVLSDRLAAGDLAQARRLLQKGKLVPLQRFFEIGAKEWSAGDDGGHYAQGYVLIYWLMNSDDELIKGRFTAFMAKLSETQDYRASFAATIGALDAAALERSFREFVRRGR
jgi:hypothetical protein